jgi:hypothetical protein
MRSLNRCFRPTHFVCGLTLLAVVVPASALDPGTVKGTFEVDGKPVELKFVYAHLHDNREGVLDYKRELRVLFTDREVSPEVLRGLNFLPIEDLAREDKVKGLMFELDPSKPNSIVSVLLAAPKQEGASLVRTTYSTTGMPLFKSWSFTPQRVTGSIDRREERPENSSDIPSASFALEFSAPVLNEPPVTADLKGPAARTSPQAKLVAEMARLLGAGNLAGFRKLQSERAGRQLDLALKAHGSEVAKQAKAGAADMQKSAAKIQRVVVRGDHAVALISRNEWMTFVREGGRWKADM